jgi:hypothetical protein
MTRYSITSFSLPVPCTSEPFLPYLVSFWRLDIRTTACRTAAPSIGNLAARWLTNCALLWYLVNSQTTFSPLTLLPILALNESYIPSVHILRKVLTSPSAKALYISRCKATAVGAIWRRWILILRLYQRAPFGDADFRIRTDRKSRR